MNENYEPLAIEPADMTIPPHNRLQRHREHGQHWLTCLDCGAQWSIDNHGDHPEQVSEGDGWCDDRM